MARNVAISTARVLTAEYMVFRAAKIAPTAMMMLITRAMSPRKRAKVCDCCA